MDCKESGVITYCLGFILLGVCNPYRRLFSALTDEMATKLVLEKESRQYNWERAFDEIQSKERNSDRFSGLSVDIAGSLSNEELNR